MGRILPFVAVIASLVAFTAEVDSSNGWWVYALDRGSYVLIVLAVVLALMTERQANAVVLGAQFAAAVTALVFMAVALVRFYNSISAFGVATGKAYPWATEALVLATTALAFGLTLARRSSTVSIVGLVAAIAVAFGCAIYAITQHASYAAELWWWLAIAGAFLATAFAAGLERDSGTIAADAPVSSDAAGEPASDPGVE
jgi:hypothetical protein